MTELPLTYTTEPRPLSAALCDATGHLSMASLETRLIVAATRHADLLGVGYRELAAKGLAWVLSRMSIEMTAMPGILDVFSITTWVESFNRHLSYRNFAIHGADGSPIGYARSLWACIDINLRRTSELGSVPGCETALECPIAPIRRVAAPGPDAEVLPGGFTYSDLDSTATSIRHAISSALPTLWASTGTTPTALRASTLPIFTRHCRRLPQFCASGARPTR